LDQILRLISQKTVNPEHRFTLHKITKKVTTSLQNAVLLPKNSYSLKGKTFALRSVRSARLEGHYKSLFFSIAPVIVKTDNLVALRDACCTRSSGRTFFLSKNRAQPFFSNILPKGFGLLRANGAVEMAKLGKISDS
jgi:hypothetical protein